MRPKQGRLSTLVGCLLLAALTSPLQAAGPAQSAAQLTGLLLTWQRDPTTTMTIDWHFRSPGGEVPAPPEPRLAYQAAGSERWQEAAGSVVGEPLPERIVHRAELTGLEPGTTYRFRLEGVDRTYSFRTMPRELRSPIRFAAGGDTRHQQAWMERMNRVVMKYDPDFIVWGGDLAYANGIDHGPWYEWFDANLNTLVAPDGRIVPVLAGIGNHEVQQGFHTNHAGYTPTDEWRTRIAPFFYSLLAFPSHPGYRVLDFGQYLSLIFLDTEHTNPIAGRQTEWLEQVLAERTGARHIIPVYHIPGFPSVRSFNDSVQSAVRRHWAPLFERYGVRVALENHDHAYKRTVPIRGGQEDPEGVVYLGDGAWGVSTRPIHSVPATWYLAYARSVRHGIISTIEAGQQHYVAVDENGEEFDELYVNGVRIEAPRNGTLRTVDEPVRISLDPEIRPTGVEIWLDDERIYKGHELPQGLRLSDAVAVLEEGEHRLAVTITDAAGARLRQVSTFQLHRASITSPPDGRSALRGDVPLQFAITLGHAERLAQVRVGLVPIVDGEPQEEILLYTGGEVPGELRLRTEEFPDGAYDLTFTVSTDRGAVSGETRRIVVRNWTVLTDPLLPPTSSGWFGSFDRLKTKDRSDNWTFLGDQPEDRFGDAERMARTGETAAYLTWEMPRLRRYQFKVYARDASIADLVAIDLSADGKTWQSSPYTSEVVERSDDGWHSLLVGAEVSPGAGANYVRFTLRGPAPRGQAIELGETVITGAYGE